MFQTCCGDTGRKLRQETSSTTNPKDTPMHAKSAGRKAPLTQALHLERRRPIYIYIYIYIYVYVYNVPRCPKLSSAFLVFDLHRFHWVNMRQWTCTKQAQRVIQKYHDCVIVVRPCSAVVQRCQGKSLRRKDVLPKILARELG